MITLTIFPDLRACRSCRSTRVVQVLELVERTATGDPVEARKTLLAAQPKEITLALIEFDRTAQIYAEYVRVSPNSMYTPCDIGEHSPILLCPTIPQLGTALVHHAYPLVSKWDIPRPRR